MRPSLFIKIQKKQIVCLWTEPASNTRGTANANHIAHLIEAAINLKTSEWFCHPSVSPPASLSMVDMRPDRLACSAAFRRRCAWPWTSSGSGMGGGEGGGGGGGGSAGGFGGPLNNDVINFLLPLSRY